MDIEIKKKIKNTRYIEIDIKDAGEFTDVALLVDNKNFLYKVEKLREKYHLTYDFPANSKGDDFFMKLNISSNNDLKKHFEADVNEIRKLFYRPTHFNPVIRDAIIYGYIGEKTYSRAYLEQQEFFDTEDEDMQGIPDMKYSIVIHQRTRWLDVERAFKEFQKLVEDNIRSPKGEGANYETGFWADLGLQHINDTASSIETLHKWYISGKKPLQLALEEKGYTREEYLKIKNAVKSKSLNLLIAQQENDYKSNEQKLKLIISKRNSIKEQLKEYRKLLHDSNTTIQYKKFVNS